MSHECPQRHPSLEQNSKGSSAEQPIALSDDEIVVHIRRIGDLYAGSEHVSVGCVSLTAIQ